MCSQSAQQSRVRTWVGSMKHPPHIRLLMLFQHPPHLQIKEGRNHWAGQIKNFYMAIEVMSKAIAFIKTDFEDTL